jgi:glycosyltransferase involved in cell wall biosynthesis
VLVYVLKIRPEIVHYNVSFQSFGKNKLTNLAGLSTILACRLLGFHVLAGVHTLGEKADLKKFHVKPSLINRTGILMATKIILSAQTVVVLVKSYGDFLKNRYHHKGVQYIPHGTTVDKNPETHNSEKIILIFGHMGPHKGLPLMLQAFEQLCKEKNGIKLYVAGSNHPNFPTYLDQFKQAHPSGVEFLGYIPQENLSSVFKRAQVVVLPYHAAPGTSGVFHLSCGYGRPIVASDLPEIRELVNDGASAILIPPNDAETLKNAILTVLTNEGLAAKMSLQNLSFAQKESWSAVGKAYETAYLKLLR